MKLFDNYNDLIKMLNSSRYDDGNYDIPKVIDIGLVTEILQEIEPFISNDYLKLFGKSDNFFEV